jgi:hypothetical protein
MEDRRTHAEVNRLQSETRAAEMALTYYRKALELESKSQSNALAASREDQLKIHSLCSSLGSA